MGWKGHWRFVGLGLAGCDIFAMPGASLGLGFLRPLGSILAAVLGEGIFLALESTTGS